MLIQRIITQPLKLLDISMKDARHILAARSWCILRRAGYNPVPRLRAYLQHDLVATRYALLMETVMQIWPYPFEVHCPCCLTASLDEALLTEAVRLAGLGARPEFDRLLREMLPSEARDIFFSHARLLYGG